MIRTLSVAAIAGVAATLVVAPQTSVGAFSERDQPRALYAYGYDFLARLDPTTLQVRAKLSGFAPDTGDVALTPDGSRLVVGSGFMGDGTYAVADALRMRWLDRRVKVALGPGGYAAVGNFEWLRPHRVFALVEGTGPVAAGPIPWTLATIVDVGRKRTVAKRRLPGYVVTSERDRDREVLLLLDFHRVAAWRLAVVDARGAVRSVVVRLPAARYSNDGFTAVGLAVDTRGERAFLLPGGGPIAVVDLRRLRVHYRRWPSRAVVRAKPYLRSPKNHEGDPVGPMRWAAWLGNGTIAVAGEDDRWRRSRFGATLSRPYGVELIDTRRWTARVVAPWANRFWKAGSTVFPFIGDALYEELNPPPGSGLHAFSSRGEPLYHLYGNHAIAPTLIGRQLYVRGPGRVDVVAIGSSKRVRTIRFRGARGHQLFPSFGRAG